MKRSAITLIELLVIVAIIAIFACLLLGGNVRCNGYDKSTEVTGKYVCVKTYTTTVSKDSSQKRVDLRPVGGGNVLTFVCDDSYWAGVQNSATLYAQFEAGRTYQVTTRGTRSETWSRFPIVISVVEVKE